MAAVLGIRDIFRADPDPDSTPFFNDFKDVKKINFFLIVAYNLPTGYIIFCLKKIFVVKIFGHYFSPLKTFMRKEEDPEPDPNQHL